MISYLGCSHSPDCIVEFCTLSLSLSLFLSSAPLVWCLAPGFQKLLRTCLKTFSPECDGPGGQSFRAVGSFWAAAWSVELDTGIKWVRRPLPITFSGPQAAKTHPHHYPQTTANNISNPESPATPKPLRSTESLPKPKARQSLCPEPACRSSQKC